VTQANDSIDVTPGTGATVATHLAGGKEHQVVMVADEDGHVQGSNDTWLLYQTPRVLTAAATDLFDLFNASGSGKLLRLRSLFAIRQRTAALATVPDWQFDAIRTSAVGTGGTAVVAGAATAAPSAGVLSLQDADTSNAALPAQITARSLPTGGATAEAFLFSTFLSGIHSATARDPAFELMSGVNLVPELPYANPFILREGQGLKMRQITATASTGVAFGWLCAFTVS
jgi:hypothetical protein